MLFQTRKDLSSLLYVVLGQPCIIAAFNNPDMMTFYHQFQPGMVSDTDKTTLLLVGGLGRTVILQDCTVIHPKRFLSDVIFVDILLYLGESMKIADRTHRAKLI